MHKKENGLSLAGNHSTAGRPFLLAIAEQTKKKSKDKTPEKEEKGSRQNGHHSTGERPEARWPAF